MNSGVSTPTTGGTKYFFLVFGLVLFVSSVSVDAGELVVTPPQVTLSDLFARQQLLVERDGDDLTHQASYTSQDEAIVSVDERGYLVPVGTGMTDVHILMDGQAVSVPVQVGAAATQRPIDFAMDIEPLLTRSGCNSGGCHGKASGQNGFRLSLLGFDAEFDYDAIVHESRGRRIMPTAPEQSLFLMKATGQLPHGGGQRIEVGSEPYEMLLTWIQAGAPAANPDAPHVTALTVTPQERILAAGGEQQLRVIAQYSDGSDRDVTRQTDFASNLDVVARVDETGLVSALEQSGEATIMARYMGQVAVFRAIRPHGAPLTEIPGFAPLTEIDRLAAEKWMKLGLMPSDECDDATFLRRVTIDLCGRLPTVEESREFLSDQSSDKRERLIDRLLDSPDYPAYFALKWSAVLRNSPLAGAEQAAYAFHNWIKDSIAQNRPYDEFVRGILAASGEWQDAPAINWYWQSRDDQLHTVTADTAQLFLGIRLQCARCHHHPYERWGQEDYYGLAGFYTRLGRKSFGQPPPYYSSSQVTTGERNPLTGETPEPKYPDGDYIEFTPEQDPRHALVDWMSSPENPYFAKALVNRLWAHFFGRGLVHELDDMRETNPPSNPEILDYLAQEFIHSNFDTRHIIRLIVTSRVYALSSTPTPQNEHDHQNFARFYARRLIAEVLLDAVDQTCGSRSNFGNMRSDARAVDLPHEGFGSYFMDTFDRPRRVTVCECERSPGATLSQVLLLGNSDEIENKIASGEGRIARFYNQEMSDEQRVQATPTLVEDLFLAAFSRYPTDQERQSAFDYITLADNSRAAAEDILWTLLNSREFSFNH